jgi:[ribosomal protein S5]-alanine N-acetyltransferase
MASRGSVSHRPADVAPGELRTARLVLRAFAPADEAEVVGLWNDPDVGRYRWDGQPVAAARVRAQIAESRRAFAACGIGLYTARPAAAPGAVIGAAGLARIGGQPEPDLLYALLPAFWGRGPATEAAAEVLRVAFEVMGLDVVQAGADPPNVASFRVMTRLGMTYERTVTIAVLRDPACGQALTSQPSWRTR